MTTVTDQSCIGPDRANRILGQQALQAGQKAVENLADELVVMYQDLGRDLMAAIQAKRWIAGDVVRDQIVELQRTESTSRPSITVETVVLLRALLTASDARGGRDVAIWSLVRPGEGRPHGTGDAIDIGMYAGKPLSYQDWNLAADGVTQCYRDLANAGFSYKFSFGLPRNLRTDDAGIDAELRGPNPNYVKIHADIFLKAWNKRLQNTSPYTMDSMMGIAANDRKQFYDAIRLAYTPTDVFLPHDSPRGMMPASSVKGAMAMFGDSTLGKAWQDIYDNGGSSLGYLFPDEVDHLHIEISRR